MAGHVTSHNRRGYTCTAQNKGGQKGQPHTNTCTNVVHRGEELKSHRKFFSHNKTNSTFQDDILFTIRPKHIPTTDEKLEHGVHIGPAQLEETITVRYGEMTRSKLIRRGERGKMSANYLLITPACGVQNE